VSLHNFGLEWLCKIYNLTVIECRIPDDMLIKVAAMPVDCYCSGPFSLLVMSGRAFRQNCSNAAVKER